MELTYKENYFHIYMKKNKAKINNNLNEKNLLTTLNATDSSTININNKNLSNKKDNFSKSFVNNFFSQKSKKKFNNTYNSTNDEKIDFLENKISDLLNLIENFQKNFIYNNDIKNNKIKEELKKNMLENYKSKNMTTPIKSDIKVKKINYRSSSNCNNDFSKTKNNSSSFIKPQLSFSYSLNKKNSSKLLKINNISNIPQFHNNADIMNKYILYRKKISYCSNLNKKVKKTNIKIKNNEINYNSNNNSNHKKNNINNNIHQNIIKINNFKKIDNKKLNSNRVKNIRNNKNNSNLTPSFSRLRCFSDRQENTVYINNDKNLIKKINK